MHESTAGGLCSTFWKLLPRPTDGPDADTTYNSQVLARCACGGLGIASRKACNAGGRSGYGVPGAQLLFMPSKLQQLLHMRLTCTSATTLAAPPVFMQSTYIFEHTFEDGTPLLLWM